MRNLWFLLPGSVLFSVTACASDTPLINLEGECKPAFGSEVCSWARARGSDVVEVGVTVPLASIEAAPMQHAMSWPPAATAIVNLPAAATATSGFNEFTFYWESMGHPPGPYMTPHFDFHFYLVPQAERTAMDCRDETKPSTLPAEYVLPDETLPDDLVKVTGVKTLVGICVPQMGMHALPQKEFEGTETFRGTMVIGYYAGKPIFIEPMISKAMLLEKKSFELPIPTIPGLTRPHPTIFRADFDAATQSYRFTFSGFAS